MHTGGRGGAAKGCEYPVPETEEDMNTRIALLGAALSASTVLFAQNQNVYTGAVVTGQLQLFTTTNISHIAATSHLRTSGAMTAGPERPGVPRRLPPPPAIARSVFGQHIPELLSDRVDRHIPTSAQVAVPAVALSNVGFDGMTHSDQRLANSGNQFSVEPPNPSIAVANG